jgi:hypothetical protein
MTNPATPMLSRVNATQMNYARRNRMTRTRLKTARSAVRSRPCPPGSPSSAEFASNKGGPPSPVTREVAGSPAVGAHSRSRPTVAGRGRPCVTVEHPVALVRSGRLAHPNTPWLLICHRSSVAEPESVRLGNDVRASRAAEGDSWTSAGAATVVEGDASANAAEAIKKPATHCA